MEFTTTCPQRMCGDVNVLQRAENKLLTVVMDEYRKITEYESKMDPYWWDNAYVPSPYSFFNVFEEGLTDDQMLGKILLLAHDYHIFFKFDDDDMINVPILEVW
jgi:hypothetical protein